MSEPSVNLLLTISNEPEKEAEDDVVAVGFAGGETLFPRIMLPYPYDLVLVAAPVARTMLFWFP